MTENPKLEDMACDNNTGEKGSQKNWVSSADNMNGFGLLQQQYSNIKSESIVVDMERFSSLLLEKDINSNSRLTRNLSRKGSIRSDKKINSIGNNIGNERNMTSLLATSPRAATLQGGSSTPEHPVVEAVGATDHHQHQHHHHQITIVNGSATGAVSSESKMSSGKRFSFRRNSSTWSIDPRRILLLFATLSCMGTMVLIYFTLSMTKINNGDDTNALN